MRGVKIILLILILIAFLLPLFGNLALAQQNCASDRDCPTGRKCVAIEQGGEKKCRRPLEVVYPNIPGLVKPETTDVPLPSYVNYIFRFAIAVIGFIILGAMVFAGFSYFLSFNNPAKLQDAKEGIFAAFLGGVILLASFLIFNTINPQLTIITPPDLSLLGGVAIPGIYICNYNVENEGYLQGLGYSNLTEVFTDYIAEDSSGSEKEQEKKQIKATQTLGKLIYKNTSEQCQRINSSVESLPTPLIEGSTAFAVPTVKTRPRTDQDPTSDKKTIHEAIYNYALILHEEDNFGGWSAIAPMGSTPYKQFYVQAPMGQFKVDRELDSIRGKARSITLLGKPQDLKGGEVIFYSCYEYGKICPELGGETVASEETPVPIPAERQILPVGPIYRNVYHNVRSLKTRSENGLIVLISGIKDPTDPDSDVVSGRFDQDQGNLKSLEWCGKPGEIALGGNSCALTNSINPLYWIGLMSGQKCVPCADDIRIIQGKIL